MWPFVHGVGRMVVQAFTLTRGGSSMVSGVLLNADLGMLLDIW